MSQPEAIMVAGPNGAGKTTFVQHFQSKYSFPYISADLLAARLDPEAPQHARIQAGRQFFSEIRSHIATQQSFLVESTLSGRNMVRVIQELKAIPYTISVVFIFLDTPTLCLERIQERVRQGGHNVPDADVLRRFYRSNRNFWTVYRPLVDRWALFANMGATFEPVGTGDTVDMIIQNGVLFELFLNMIKE